MQFLNGPYPIRPRPKEGELYIGYILRVAKANGRLTFGQLFGDFQSHVRIRSFIVGSKDYYEVLPYFANGLNISFSILKDHFETEKNLLELSANTIYRTKVGKPVFCPHCLAESGFLKCSWLFLHVNQCEIHQCNLYHACPKCGKHQKWESTLFEGCTYCDYKWSETKVNSVLMPSYSKFLKSMTKTQHDFYLNVLYKYVRFAIRPYDATYAVYRQIIEHLDNMTEYFEFAHQIAHQEQMRVEYAKRRKQYFQNKLKLNKNNRLLNIINLELLPANDEIDRFQADELKNLQSDRELVIPNCAPIKVLTANRYFNSAKNDVQFHLEWKDVQKILTMSQKDLIKLISAGLFIRRTHATCDKKLIAPGLNDILNFHNKIISISKPLIDLDPDYAISWIKTKRVLRSTKTMSELVIAVFNSEMTVYLDCKQDDYLFEDFYFNIKEVEIFKTAA